jgi:4-amino-4-deoxy-L-arabinose transferase-like glycosyltransferase
MNSDRLGTWIALLLLVVSALFWAHNLSARKLAKPDEGRYAEIAREMAASGDFITPRLNGLKYFEKPPMQYWATSTAYRAFGVSEWTARLWTTLCALLAVLASAWAAAQLWGWMAGTSTALVLLGSPYFAALAQINTLDMGLTGFTTLTLMSYLVANARGTPGRPHRGWLALAWAAAALAVLSKGLIGLVFPAATVFIYAMAHGEPQRILRMNWAGGSVLFLLLAAPWFVAVSLANDEFARFFFIHEHFERFLTTTHRREEPWWYFAPVTLAGLLPWTLLLIPATIAAWREQPDAMGFRPMRFCLLWSLIIFNFFSASGSKLPAYVLPIFPALAVCIVGGMRTLAPRQLRWWLIPMPVAALGLATFAWLAPDRRANDAFILPLYQDFARWMLVAAGVMLLGYLLTFWKSLQGSWTAIALAGLSMLLSVQFMIRGYEAISPLQSSAELARRMQPHLDPEIPVYAVRMYDQTLPFYLGRTLTLVDHVDEFALGLSAEPTRALRSLDAFKAAWTGQQKALAIMTPDTLQHLRAAELPMQVIAQDPRRVVVRKP